MPANYFQLFDRPVLFNLNSILNKNIQQNDALRKWYSVRDRNNKQFYFLYCSFCGSKKRNSKNLQNMAYYSTSTVDVLKLFLRKYAWVSLGSKKSPKEPQACLLSKYIIKLILTFHSQRHLFRFSAKYRMMLIFKRPSCTPHRQEFLLQILLKVIKILQRVRKIYPSKIWEKYICFFTELRSF